MEQDKKPESTRPIVDDEATEATGGLPCMPTYPGISYKCEKCGLGNIQTATCRYCGGKVITVVGGPIMR